MASGDRIYVADKETLDEVLETVKQHSSILSVNPVYGFIEHMDELDPTKRIEYIGANANYSPLTVDVAETHVATYNEWANFPILKANKPWMVRSDGTPDYQLLETDYTKKEDGTTDSDVTNTEYDGGAFSWLIKHYKYEKNYGSDRVVMYSMTPRPGFEPVGFTDGDNNELEGLWIPMFYGATVILNSTTRMTSLSGLQPDHSKTTDQQKTLIDAFSTRARFFGGAVINVIADLLMMWAKTTDVQLAYGFGNMSGYVDDSTVYYGVLQNAVVSGGQFYGTNGGKALNKILHSIVLGTYQQWQRDPYTLCYNGKILVSPNYTYDLTAATYKDTGLIIPNNSDSGWVYPHKYKTIPNFGSFSYGPPYRGSQTTGGTDGLYIRAEQSTFSAVSRRFGSCSNGRLDGPRAVSLNAAADYTDWNFGSSVLLLPPVGVAA